MRVGQAEHQILYAHVAQDETVQRAPSEARVARRPYPDNGRRFARPRIPGLLGLGDFQHGALRHHTAFEMPLS